VNSWSTTKISEFLFEREGKYKPNDASIAGLKRIDKIDFSGQFHIASKSSRTNMIMIYPGDLVISGINVSKGAMGIYDGDEVVTATIHYSSYTFDTNRINVEYFKRFLRSAEFIRLLQEQVKGGIKTEIKPKHILPLEINLPPLDVQEKIVSHFEKVETEDKDLKGEITHQQTLLKKLRQQILQEAIEGRLTEEFRIKNREQLRVWNDELRTASDPEAIRDLKLKIRNCSESAASLLSRINAEKEQLIKDKKIKKQKPLPPITDEEKPFALPDGWVWCRIGVVTNVVTSGSRNWKSLYSKSGASFIRSQDIKLDRLCFANRAFVNVPDGQEGARTFVNQYDWLIIITGANVGKCAYIADDPGEAYVSQHVGLMRPTIKTIGEYGHLWLISEFGGRGLLSKSIYGDKPGLNLPQLRNLPIPLPPLHEQKAIVAKVERLLAVCDQLESQITDNQTHAEQLMQAVLKEAFQQTSTEKEAA